MHLPAGRAWDTERSLIRVSTSKKQLKHRCVINLIFILNPRGNSISTTRKKINSTPAESRTPAFSGKTFLCRQALRKKYFQFLVASLQYHCIAFNQNLAKLTSSPTASKKRYDHKRLLVYMQVSFQLGDIFCLMDFLVSCHAFKNLLKILLALPEAFLV